MTSTAEVRSPVQPGKRPKKNPNIDDRLREQIARIDEAHSMLDFIERSEEVAGTTVSDAMRGVRRTLRAASDGLFALSEQVRG